MSAKDEAKKWKPTEEDIKRAKEENEKMRPFFDAMSAYNKKFGENPPAIGYGFNPDINEYVELLNRCVKEGKKLKVKVPDWYKDVIF